jgi:hypothetical protein
MRKILSSLAILSLLASPLACDLRKTANQLQADKVIVATVLATPPIELSPEALAGANGLDAGMALDGGTVTLPSETAAFVFFGQGGFASLDKAPTPVSGATATIRTESGQPIGLTEDSTGSFTATSVQKEALQYQSGANYLFEVSYQGGSYVGRVDQAPQLERIDAFHPPTGFTEQPANQAFTFQRPDAPQGQERNLGFVTVFPVDSSGQKGSPTWTNVPTQPLDFLKLVALPSKWKESSVTVPGTAFPQQNQTYLVVLQAMKLGGPESDNLFTGSAVLAGTADVGVIRTK